jgi:hypothetical protein
VSRHRVDIETVSGFLHESLKARVGERARGRPYQ